MPLISKVLNKSRKIVIQFRILQQFNIVRFFSYLIKSQLRNLSVKKNELSLKKNRRIYGFCCFVVTYFNNILLKQKRQSKNYNKIC